MTDTLATFDRLGLASRERVRRFTVLRHWIREYGFAGAVYIAATLLTRAHIMGDTGDYVDSITSFSRGVNHWMWDFAHLLWRPLGWLVASAFLPLTRLVVGDDERLNVLLTLVAINWIAGLVSVFLIYSLARKFSDRKWVANVAALAFIFAHAFLNFAHAGTAYIPAMALLLVGFHLLMTNAINGSSSRKACIGAGAALAAAVCLWVPFALAIPAAVLAPLFLVRFDRHRARLALQTAVAFAVFTLAAYVAVIAAQRLHTTDQLRSWIAWSSHGTDFGGVKRVVFGLPRTFIDMGNDGLLFKRYLLRDPFNPVALRDLVVGSLWKLGLFYLFAGSLIVSLLSSTQSRRVLALLLLNGIPVIGFAIFFAGSDIERYLALYPMTFVAIATALSNRSPRLVKLVVIVFITSMIAVNSTALARTVLDREAEAAATRVRDLLPRIDSRSLVLVPNWQDRLITFTRIDPFHPINRSGQLRVTCLVTPGTSWNLHWREDFATNVLSAWKRGGTVWISLRALSPRPQADWNWAEGDDRRVSWRDFPALVTQMELGESVGGPDGFALLPASPKNERFLNALASSQR